jgi:uncharacterized protein YndB with AHSA1/START domain
MSPREDGYQLQGPEVVGTPAPLASAHPLALTNSYSDPLLVIQKRTGAAASAWTTPVEAASINPKGPFYFLSTTASSIWSSSRNVYTFTEHDGGTRATYVSTFESTEALQQVLEMGIVEGSSLAINQIDDLVGS